MLLALPLVIVLNGPWKFHTGDDPRWADSAFDDARWETVDLTPAPGAHDSDVGLPGYVPGWTARGHRGYAGVAWYRMRVDLASADTIALDGSPDVDDAYELFVNGVRVGANGAPYSIQPRLFVLPPLHSAVIAVRVWVDAATVRGSPDDAGGMHIAPAIGDVGSMRDRVALEWVRTIRGYVVDAVEPLIFVALAALALALRARWMAAALVVTAVVRVQQATFFWGQFETIAAYEIIRRVLVPCMLGAWVMAWRDWFAVRRLLWPIAALSAITVVWPSARIAFLPFMALTIAQGWRQWLAVLAAILVSIGLFAQELSTIGVPGIWFPFGTGVSRTQFAYAAFDVALLALFSWTISSLSAETSLSTS